MPGNSREDFALVVADLSKEGGSEEPGREVAISHEPEETGREVAVSTPSPPASEERKTDHPVPADKQPAKKEVVVATPKPGGLAAPVSWKPEEREGWAGLKPIHQQAIHRREREVERALLDTARSRAFVQEFGRMIDPYMGMITSEGSDPINAVNHLMSMAMLMRTGSPTIKAQEIAKACVQFNIPLDTLDYFLRKLTRPNEPMVDEAGAPIPVPGTAMDAVASMLDQRLAPFMQFMNSVQQGQIAREDHLTQTAQQTWDEFCADPAHEFAADVQQEMADLLEFYAQRQEVLSLQDAYKLATMRHPTISQVLRSRTQANGAAQQTAAARRALDAAASLASNGGAPSQGGEDEGDGSIRSAVSAAWREVAARH